MARPRTAKHPAPAEIPAEEQSQEPPETEPKFKLEEPPVNGQTTKAVSKADAVRDALANGLDAPGDIVDFVKSRHGLDMPKQMASSYKAQLRARDAKAAGGEDRPHAPRRAQPTGQHPRWIRQPTLEGTIQAPIEKDRTVRRFQELIGPNCPSSARQVRWRVGAQAS